MSELYNRDITLLRDNRLIMGVDEAGRGALAGPVVCAAVILNYAEWIDGLNDSKLLNARRRETLYSAIIANSMAHKMIGISADFIDEHNILQATLEGMRQAIDGIDVNLGFCLIDGNQLPFKHHQSCHKKLVQHTVVDGDALHACIAAASILAKVTRDRMMIELHNTYPQYGFDRHKGYGTASHLKAILEHGPCPEHRKSFAPIRDYLLVRDIFQ